MFKMKIIHILEQIMSILGYFGDDTVFYNIIFIPCMPDKMLSQYHSQRLYQAL